MPYRMIVSTCSDYRLLALPADKGKVHAPISTSSTVQTTLASYLTRGLPCPQVSLPPVAKSQDHVPGMSDEDTPCQVTNNLHKVSTPDCAVWQPDVALGFEDFGAGYIPDHPDTPSPPEKVPKLGLLEVSNDDATAQGSMLAFNLGYPLTVITEALEESFQMINDAFSELAGQASMPFQQVISHFTKQFSCLNSANYWNFYQRYLMVNKAQELARLEESELVHGTPCKWPSSITFANHV